MMSFVDYRKVDRPGNGKIGRMERQIFRRGEHDVDFMSSKTRHNRSTLFRRRSAGKHFRADAKRTVPSVQMQ